MTVLVRSAVVMLSAVLIADAASAERPPRAPAPELTDEDRVAFFDNAFDALVGEQPDYGAQQATELATGDTDAAAGGWADWIDAEALETEIKRLARQAQDATRSVAAFKGGESTRAADALGQVAIAFAVTTRHDGSPRWRDEAAQLAPHFARAAAAADAGSDGGYRLGKAASEDLAALVRGERPDVGQPADDVEWGAYASRSSLMRRMTLADEQRLPEWTADRRTFRRKAEDARHEAQVLAMLAEAILAPGADDADDPGYQAYSRQLRAAAERLRSAAEDEDQPAAAAAAAAIRQSCLDCHSDYRG
ncbi:MAG: cytochrome c [Planctomycetota bacterium]